MTATPSVEAPPPVGITVEQLAAYDRQFIANLEARGWTVVDPQTMAQRAHQVCAALQNGVSPQSVGQQIAASGALRPAEAASFVTTTMLTYPSCP